MAEAVEWVKRCPNPMLGPSEIEIRPVFEMADFGEALTPELAELHDRTREKAEAPPAPFRLGPSRRRCLRGRALFGSGGDRNPSRRSRRSSGSSRPADRGPRPHGARRRPGRGAGAGRARRPRSPNGRGAACRATPGAWLMAAAKRRAIDGFRRERMLARKHAEIGRDLEDGTRHRRRGGRGGDRRRHRRRASGPDLHRLPPGLVDRGARGADLAPDRRADHRRDRPRLPVDRSDHRPAHRAGQEDARQGRPHLRGAARQERTAAPRLGAGGRLPDLQRGLCGHRRRGPDPPGPVRRGAAPRPHPRRPDARRARGLRSPRADGDPGLAPRRPHGPGRLAGPPDRAEPRPLGPAPDPPRPRRPGRAEALGGADGPYALQAALAACHARARKAEETDWRRIAALYDTLREVMPSPVVDLNRAVAHSMAFGPEAGLALLDEIDRCRFCAATRRCRRPRGISCSGPAGWPRPRSSSSGRLRSPATRARRPFSSAGGGLRRLPRIAEAAMTPVAPSPDPESDQDAF